MKLLEIAPDLFSLEYSPSEAKLVAERQSRFGRVSIERHRAYEIVRVAGEEFLRDDEWDEPCLIARSRAGSAVLRAVAAQQGAMRIAS